MSDFFDYTFNEDDIIFVGLGDAGLNNNPASWADLIECQGEKGFGLRACLPKRTSGDTRLVKLYPESDHNVMLPQVAAEFISSLKDPAQRTIIGFHTDILVNALTLAVLGGILDKSAMHFKTINLTDILFGGRTVTYVERKLAGYKFMRRVVPGHSVEINLPTDTEMLFEQRAKHIYEVFKSLIWN